MRKPLFSGVCTAMVTPFLDGKVNYPMAKALLRRQMDAGIKAVVLAGTTGEAATLSDREKIELFYQCKEYAKDDCMILAGTGSNSTAHAVKLSIEAERAGADGLLVVSPYYNKATAEGLFAHYLAIASSVSIPVIIYNVPSRTGVDIPVSVYKDLSEISNIAGVKEASTDLTKITKIKASCAGGFSVWSGNDALTLPVMALGGDGVICVTSNICPEEMIALAHAATNEDYENAAQMQQALQPLMDLLFCEVNPIPVKAAMNMIGYDCGGCRMPLCGLSKDHELQLKSFFSE